MVGKRDAQPQPLGERPASQRPEMPSADSLRLSAASESALAAENCCFHRRSSPRRGGLCQATEGGEAIKQSQSFLPATGQFLPGGPGLCGTRTPGPVPPLPNPAASASFRSRVQIPDHHLVPQPPGSLTCHKHAA